MKISDLLACEQDIKTICTADPKFPVKISYTVAVNKQKIAHALEPFREEQKRIFRECSDGKESIIKDTPEFRRFLTETEELMKQDADVEIKKFNIKDLKTDDLSVNVMNALMFMIEE